MIKTFEDFLKDWHVADYLGTGDDTPDDFVNWTANLDYEDYCSYAEEYARKEVESALEAARITQHND